jgi:glycosyltransferase involved in cell wall biosynthesis
MDPQPIPLISVIVPVKDEEDAIQPFVLRVGNVLEALRDPQGAPVLWEMLFIDDGSSDATLAAIMAANRADPRVVGISLSRNFGKEAALSAGLDHVRGQTVVPIDVDLQDPPEVIGAMLDEWRLGHEVVFGVRRNRMTDSLRSLAPEGRLLVLGFAGGEIPVVKVNRLLLGNTGVLGVASREFFEQRPALMAELWEQLMELWRTRMLADPPVEAYPFADARGALRAIAERRALGKVVLSRSVEP